jgi:hypothetical protein
MTYCDRCNADTDNQDLTIVDACKECGKIKEWYWHGEKLELIQEKLI